MTSKDQVLAINPRLSCRARQTAKSAPHGGTKLRMFVVMDENGIIVGEAENHPSNAWAAALRNLKGPNGSYLKSGI